MLDGDGGGFGNVWRGILRSVFVFVFLLPPLVVFVHRRFNGSVGWIGRPLIDYGSCIYQGDPLISRNHQWHSMKKTGKLVMGIFPRSSPASAREKSGRFSMKSER